MTKSEQKLVGAFQGRDGEYNDSRLFIAGTRTTDVGRLLVSPQNGFRSNLNLFNSYFSSSRIVQYIYNLTVIPDGYLYFGNNPQSTLHNINIRFCIMLAYSSYLDTRMCRCVVVKCHVSVSPILSYTYVGCR